MPIWLTRRETARRVRQRIAMVVDWAVAEWYRATPLAMAALNKSLPKAKRKVEHQAAVPCGEVPAFAARLRERESVGRLAFEMLVLTALRSGEIRGALWSVRQYGAVEANTRQHMFQIWVGKAEPKKGMFWKQGRPPTS